MCTIALNCLEKGKRVWVEIVINIAMYIGSSYNALTLFTMCELIFNSNLATAGRGLFKMQKYPQIRFEKSTISHQIWRWDL